MIIFWPGRSPWLLHPAVPFCPKAIEEVKSRSSGWKKKEITLFWTFCQPGGHIRLTWAVEKVKRGRRRVPIRPIDHMLSQPCWGQSSFNVVGGRFPPWNCVEIIYLLTSKCCAHILVLSGQVKCTWNWKLDSLSYLAILRRGIKTPNHVPGFSSMKMLAHSFVESHKYKYSLDHISHSHRESQLTTHNQRPLLTRLLLHLLQRMGLRYDFQEF